MIRSMRVARSGVKAVAMDGLLYVVGGWDGRQRLRSGEVYNPDTGMWTDLPDMMTPRSNHTLAVVQGRLMAVGGYQGVQTTRKVEVLDMTTHSWEAVGELSSSRSALVSAVVIFNSLEEEVRESLRWQGSQGEDESDEMKTDVEDCADFIMEDDISDTEENDEDMIVE